jgi:uncharacterized protein (DUF427 family)
MPEMRVPGPDHPITVTATPKRVQVRYGEHVIADSRMALTLQESTYPPVIYFPREDVSMEFFSRTEKTTHCPYKGDANYYTILMDGRFAENAVWTYEDPYPAMETIRSRLAFYPNQVDIYDVAEASDSEAVTQAILHTDDGAGSSQREAWPPTVDQP